MLTDPEPAYGDGVVRLGPVTSTAAPTSTPSSEGTRWTGRLTGASLTVTSAG